MRHRIAELEFYYNTAVFPDPYPHGDELQRTAGQWYARGCLVTSLCGQR